MVEQTYSRITQLLLTAAMVNENDSEEEVMTKINDVLKMENIFKDLSDDMISSLQDFSCELDEMRCQMRNEKLRTMVAILLKECYKDDEVIDLAVEMECIVDEIKKFINSKHLTLR